MVPGRAPRPWPKAAPSCSSSSTARPSSSDKLRRARHARGRRASRRPGCRCSTSTRSAARTSWCSTAPPSRSTRIARCACRRRAGARRWCRRAGSAGPRGWTIEPGMMEKPPRRARRRSISAMVLGLRDYVRKNRFPGVVLGLSGGIDSALTAAVAVDALGADKVHCVMMPSPYTSARKRRGRGGGGAAARASNCATSSIDAGDEGLRGDAQAVLRGPRARHHRGEHPVARARHDADGAFQQIRLDGAVDRQQIGDVGGLRHALRRHVRRLFGAEGRLQDDGLRALRAGATRTGPTGSSGPSGRVMPERVITKPPTRRTEARPDRPGHPAALRGARRRFWNAWSSTR